MGEPYFQAGPSIKIGLEWEEGLLIFQERARAEAMQPSPESALQGLRRAGGLC